MPLHWCQKWLGLELWHHPWSFVVVVGENEGLCWVGASWGISA